MLRTLDDTLEALLKQTWRKPPDLPEVLFDAPDGDPWKARVGQGNTVKLDVYLIDVRENPTFRRPEWDEIPLPDRTIVRSRPPAYVDAHYLVSAWSPAQNDAAKIEHAVLGGALRVFLQNPDVRPALLGIGGAGPVFDESDVYLTAAPSETSHTLSEFWTSMKQPWRPAVQLVATAPLDLLQDAPPDFPVVTLVRRLARFTPPDDKGPLLDESIAIGGWVVRAADGTPIEDAEVTRVATGSRTKTNDKGQFLFNRIPAGRHRLRAVAKGFPPKDQWLDVPNGQLNDHVFRL
jgi:uncharacterized protein DUF4255/carboxypeptidase family protein